MFSAGPVAAVSHRVLVPSFGGTAGRREPSSAPPAERKNKTVPIVFARMVGIFIFLFSPSVFALEIPEKPQKYVNDYIGMLSSPTRDRLESTLGEFEKTTSNQVVVAIFDSLEGGSLEDFSIRLAEKWKIGQKDKDNGAILLIFKADRKVRIEVGYGLEGALPDATSNQIIQNDIVPNFRAGNFDAGVEAAVGNILKATRGEYTAPVFDIKKPDKEALQGMALMAVIMFFVFPIFCYLAAILLPILILGFPLGLGVGLALAAALVFLRSLFPQPGSTLGSGGSYGGWGGFGGGGGGFGGGGSFGGGGGGSFGGGGSSGSW